MRRVFMVAPLGGARRYRKGVEQGNAFGGLAIVAYDARRMSRGAVAVAVFVVLALVAGAGFVVRARSARARAEARATATITATDPTWCGRPLGSGSPGELADPASCGKLSLTGRAPECLFWAECREEHFEIDCTSAGPGRCRCDRNDARTVPYDPAFCALDGTRPQQSLRAILDAAAVACRWTSR
jgi:hypothetical protein